MWQIEGSPRCVAVPRHHNPAREQGDFAPASGPLAHARGCDGGAKRFLRSISRQEASSSASFRQEESESESSPTIFP